MAKEDAIVLFEGRPILVVADVEDDRLNASAWRHEIAAEARRKIDVLDGRCRATGGVAGAAAIGISAPMRRLSDRADKDR